MWLWPFRRKTEADLIAVSPEMLRLVVKLVDLQAKTVLSKEDLNPMKEQIAALAAKVDLLIAAFAAAKQPRDGGEDAAALEAISAKIDAALNPPADDVLTLAKDAREAA